MKSILVAFITLAAIPIAALAQTGNDINQAIPIYFGQTINDIGDVHSTPLRAYSIVLSKGQQVSATLTSPQGSVQLSMYSSTVLTVLGDTFSGTSGTNGTVATNYSYGQATSLSYTVPTSGTYYFVTYFGSSGTQYQLQVTAQGVPITTPNPAQAGCLTGQVNNIAYSLQLIAAGLPDSITIGGTQACASCTVKPPAYPALVSKMETAMGLGVGVTACYDNSGNIFQLILNHP